jgi:hypothetical protein
MPYTLWDQPLGNGPDTIAPLQMPQAPPQAPMGMGNGGLGGLLQSLMNGGGMGGGLGGLLQSLMGGGQGMPQQPGGMPGGGDIRRLLFMQNMANSPFYQGQPTGGAGAQIVQALMPFLMSRAQAPFYEQQMQQQQAQMQNSGMETLFKALTAIVGMQTAQSQSVKAEAEAGLAKTKAELLPKEMEAKAKQRMEEMGLEREMFKSELAYKQAQLQIAREGNQIKAADVAGKNTLRNFRMTQGPTGKEKIFEFSDGENNYKGIWQNGTATAMTMNGVPVPAPIRGDPFMTMIAAQMAGSGGAGSTAPPRAKPQSPMSQPVPKDTAPATPNQTPNPALTISPGSYGAGGGQPPQATRKKVYDPRTRTLR